MEKQRFTYTDGYNDAVKNIVALLNGMFYDHRYYMKNRGMNGAFILDPLEQKEIVDSIKETELKDV